MVDKYTIEKFVDENEKMLFFLGGLIAIVTFFFEYMDSGILKDVILYSMVFMALVVFFDIIKKTLGTLDRKYSYTFIIFSLLFIIFISSTVIYYIGNPLLDILNKEAWRWVVFGIILGILLNIFTFTYYLPKNKKLPIIYTNPIFTIVLFAIMVFSGLSILSWAIKIFLLSVGFYLGFMASIVIVVIILMMLTLRGI